MQVKKGRTAGRGKIAETGIVSNSKTQGEKHSHGNLENPRAKTKVPTDSNHQHQTCVQQQWKLCLPLPTQSFMASGGVGHVNT